MSDDTMHADDFPESWWSQDECAQRGLPPEEDLPQEGAYGTNAIELIERVAESQRLALARQRDEVRRLEARRQRFFQQVQDRNTPVTPRRLCALLTPVLTSDNPGAVLLASDALALIARTVVSRGPAKSAHVRALFSRLSCGHYETEGVDRDHVRAAFTLARRLYNPALGSDAVQEPGERGGLS